MQQDGLDGPKIIESQEIRGVNLRNMIMGIGIVISISFSFFSLKGDIKSLQSDGANSSKINDMQLKALEIKIDKLELEIKDLRTQINHNTYQLRTK